MNELDQQKLNDSSLEQVEAEEIKKVSCIMQKLYKIWNEFSLENSQKSKRAKVVWSHVQTLLNDILNEEKSFYQDIKERIQRYSIKIAELSKVLSITPKEIDGSMIQKESLLRQELDALVKLKNKRVKTYEDLKRGEQKYCEILSYKEHELSFKDGVPSENDLLEIRQHVDMLKEEWDRRHKKFCSLKKELTTILETTELLPETSLEKDILAGKDVLPLSNDTFKALEDTISRALRKRAELDARKTDLINKLTILWQRLKVNEREKANFLTEHNDCRLSTLKSIEQELERCEKIKMENIKIFVDSLKQELEALWAKCHVSEEQRKLFTFYFDTDMSDQILNAHDAEVSKWKEYYNEVKHILEKIDKRHKLFDLMIMFENRESDPKRFQNRKGNLLKEEKERKRIQRDLPALENELLRDIDAYQAAKGVPFLYDGGDYRAFVASQWKERIAQKEKDRFERQKQHLLLLQDEVTIRNTPCKRPLTTTPISAPSKLFKCSILSPFRTPSKTVSKVMPKTAAKLTSTINKLNTSTSKNKVIPPVPKGRLLNGSRPAAIQMRHQKILKEKNEFVKDQSHNGTTYTDFAKELNKTNRCSSRSSVLATKKRGGGGTRTSQNKSQIQNVSKSMRKSSRNSAKATAELIPVRGKFGLPILI